MCVHVGVGNGKGYVHLYMAQGGQKRVLDPWSWGSKQVGWMWVLETKSSLRKNTAVVELWPSQAHMKARTSGTALFEKDWRCGLVGGNPAATGGGLWSQTQRNREVLSAAPCLTCCTPSTMTVA